jgi:hypothetical protein
MEWRLAIMPEFSVVHVSAVVVTFCARMAGHGGGMRRKRDSWGWGCSSDLRQKLYGNVNNNHSSAGGKHNSRWQPATANNSHVTPAAGASRSYLGFTQKKALPEAVASVDDGMEDVNKNNELIMIRKLFVLIGKTGEKLRCFVWIDDERDRSKNIIALVIISLAFFSSRENEQDNEARMSKITKHEWARQTTKPVNFYKERQE